MYMCIFTYILHGKGLLSEIYVTFEFALCIDAFVWGSIFEVEDPGWKQCTNTWTVNGSMSKVF